MINHVRTLLLNRASAEVGLSQFGYEFVPDNFQAVRLPSLLFNLVRTLFGSAPDVTGMHYRLRQYLPILHAAEVVQYMLMDDSRITYDLTDDRLFREPHMPMVAQEYGNTQASFVIPDGALETDSGKLEYNWRVIGSDFSTYGLIELDPNTIQAPISWANGLSNPLPLPNSGGISVCLTGSNMPVSDSFQISLIKKPKTQLPAVPGVLEHVLTEGVAEALFGAGAPGRFGQFADWWYHSEQLHFRLAGVLLALAHRTDLIRQGTQ